MPAIQKILYGPPGTGKTWKAARDAVCAVSPELYAESLKKPDPAAAFAELHRRLVGDGRIIWVTFHPSYSYEDFIEGYRPIVGEDGQLTYQVNDGPFKVLCNRARAESDIQIGEQLKDAKGGNAGVVVDKDPGGWLVRITPNRSDEVAPEQYKYVSRLILKRFMDARLPPSVFSIPGKTDVPLAEYGLKPSDKDVVAAHGGNEGEPPAAMNGSTVRRIVAGRALVSSSDLSNASHYGAVYRRLLRPKNGGGPTPMAIVIDEINRADLSRVFGELLTLLERDKREGMPEERRVWLPYSKTHFSIPQNVSIIGTMNTLDRSLTAMDYAMRRRFEFELLDVTPELCPEDYGGVDLREVLARINNRIAVLLGADHRLGHACLMRSALDQIVSRMNWKHQPDSELRAVAFVWRSYVVPTLLEYFHADWQKARAVAGRAIANRRTYELIDEIRPDGGLLEDLPEEYDLSEARSFSLASWWDPGDPEWDSTSFQEFLNALATKLEATSANDRRRRR